MPKTTIHPWASDPLPHTGARSGERPKPRRKKYRPGWRRAKGSAARHLGRGARPQALRTTTHLRDHLTAWFTKKG